MMNILPRLLTRNQSPRYKSKHPSTTLYHPLFIWQQKPIKFHLKPSRNKSVNFRRLSQRGFILSGRWDKYERCRNAVNARWIRHQLCDGMRIYMVKAAARFGRCVAPLHGVAPLGRATAASRLSPTALSQRPNRRRRATNAESHSSRDCVKHPLPKHLCMECAKGFWILSNSWFGARIDQS